MALSALLCEVVMPGPAYSKHYLEQRRKGFLKIVKEHGKDRRRFGGRRLPRGYKPPYKGADPRRGTVE